MLAEPKTRNLNNWWDRASCLREIQFSLHDCVLGWGCWPIGLVSYIFIHSTWGMWKNPLHLLTSASNSPVKWYCPTFSSFLWFLRHFVIITLPHNMVFFVEIVLVYTKPANSQWEKHEFYLVKTQLERWLLACVHCILQMSGYLTIIHWHWGE